MHRKNIPVLLCATAAFSLLANAQSSLAADTPAAAPVAQPAAVTPGGAPAPGANRGGGGRGGRGGPLTPEDQAAIAKLAELPAWKPGVGDGDYVMSPPYSPAPENALR